MALTHLVATRYAAASASRRILVAAPLPIPSPSALRSSAGSSCRRYSDKPPGTSEHILIYKHYGRPFLKVFLGALAVYGAVYYSWVGLEKEDMRTRGEGKNVQNR
ncbi:hypothetical protein VTO42DRAFT_2446 [Malbranchea cinnamomea]